MVAIWEFEKERINGSVLAWVSRCQGGGGGLDRDSTVRGSNMWWRFGVYTISETSATEKKVGAGWSVLKWSVGFTCLDERRRNDWFPPQLSQIQFFTIFKSVYWSSKFVFSPSLRRDKCFLQRFLSFFAQSSFLHELCLCVCMVQSLNDLETLWALLYKSGLLLIHLFFSFKNLPPKHAIQILVNLIVK